MRIKFRPGAIAATAAGGLAVAGLGTAAPALAAPITVNVPCSATALAGAISGAVGGDVLQLASNCTYLLPSALPQVTVGLTIQGSPTSTIERGYPGSLPLRRTTARRPCPCPAAPADGPASATIRQSSWGIIHAKETE